MPELRGSERGETVVVSVLRPMNDHGTVTVEVTDRHSTRHLVEYETAAVERTLSAMPRGATLRVVMTPIEGRANVWRVAAPAGRGSDDSGATTGTPPERVDGSAPTSQRD